MKAEQVEARIRGRFPDAVIVLQGEDCSFSVEITTTAFASQSLLDRQRSVLDLFTEELQSGTLHAMSIVARCPEGANAGKAS